MNEKIKKIFRAMTSAALAGAFVVSSVIGGGADSFVSSSVVFAAENSEVTNETELSAGVYTAPLIQYKSSNITKQLTNNPLHYSSSAVFTVSETGKQSLTFSIDNWSLYDAFIPMKQSYVQNYKSSVAIIPNSIFNEENRGYFGAYDSIASKYVSDAYNDHYKYGESSNKFGDFVVEQYDEVTDRAYITVDIDDYSEKFMFLAILNTPNNSANTSYYSLVTFGLNTLDVSDVSDMQDANNSRWTYKTEFLSKVEKYSEQAIYSSMVGVHYTNNANNYNAQNVFDYGEVMHNDNGTYTAKYHISDYVSYNDFKTLSSVNYREELASCNWVDCATGTFTNLESKDGYISIEYNSLLDLQLGSLIYFDVEDDGDDNYFYFCSPTWDLADIQTIKLEDAETGITVQFDTDSYSANTTFKVEKNKDFSDDPNYINYEKIIDLWWKTPYFSSYDYYTISMVDENGNVISGGDKGKLITVSIPLPDDYANNCFCCVLDENGGTRWSEDNRSVKEIYLDTESNTLIAKNAPANGYTFGIVKYNEKSDVHGLTNDSNQVKIYQANAYFCHKGMYGTASMADTGLVKQVYIVDDGSNKKLYFKAGIVTSGAYIGEVWCNNVKVDNEVYEDSISYTDFEMVDGVLTDNIVYDAITEYANVKGGILTLMDECYLDDEKVYELALVSPIMQALGGKTEYSKVDKDATCVWLRFTDLKDVTDSVRIEDIEGELGYGYQPSALLRKIRQAEIKYNIGKNTASDSTAFADAYAVYNKADATSQEIEAAINALDSVSTEVVPSAKVTGYSLTAKEDFGLHLFVNLGYDAQNDANAAVKFNIGGTEKTIAVSDATFVEGKGYEFLQRKCTMISPQRSFSRTALRSSVMRTSAHIPLQAI